MEICHLPAGKVKNSLCHQNGSCPILRSEWLPLLRKERARIEHPPPLNLSDLLAAAAITEVLNSARAKNATIGLGVVTRIFYVTLRSKIADDLTQHVTQPKGLPAALS